MIEGQTPGQRLADDLRDQAKDLIERHRLNEYAVRSAKAVAAIEELMDQNRKLREVLKSCESQMAKIGGIYFSDTLEQVRDALEKDSGL